MDLRVVFGAWLHCTYTRGLFYKIIDVSPFKHGGKHGTEAHVRQQRAPRWTCLVWDLGVTSRWSRSPITGKYPAYSGSETDTHEGYLIPI